MQPIKTLTISEKQMAALEGEMKRSLPLEACALMLGRVKGDNAVVSDIHMVENAARSPFSFSIDPDALVKAYMSADEEGKDVVGVFHSHPAPSEPSAVDLRYMSVNPIVWLIMSTLNGSYGAFQWVNGEVRTVKVNVLPS